MGTTATAQPHVYAVPLEGQDKSLDSTPVLRNPKATDGLVVNFDPPFTTLYQVFKTSCMRYPNNPCFGEQRQQAGGIKYQWLSYTDVDRLVQKAARMIQKYGFPNEEGIVAIVGPNCNAWLIVDLALNMLGLASVPFFQALSSEARTYILQETQVTSLFGTNQDIYNLLQSGNLCEVKNFICFQPISKELAALAKEIDSSLVLYDFWEELHMPQNEGHLVPPITPPGFDTLFTLSYTSGTTGTPKGTCITNGNMISAIKSHYEVDHLPPGDCLISYLPLAHVMGRLTIYDGLAWGLQIGHWGGNPKELLQDIQILKPNMFPVVPRILNKVYDKVMKGVSEASGVKRALFRKALNSKIANLRATGQYTHALYDRLVFGKLRALMGGRVRLMFTGSAPIAKEVLEFARVAFGCPVIEGYAQTESCGNAFMTIRRQTRVGHVGGPTVGTLMKLQDVPELNYHASDKPYPRGEILLKGPSIFKQYYKQPDKTAVAFDADGWLHTGDVGMLIEGNAVQIIDRKKNIFKLSQGEYIAPERLERLLETCPLIAQIFIHGDSLEDFIVGVVVPDQEVVEEWAKKNKLEGDFETLCASKELHDAIEQQAQTVGDERGFNSLERIRGNFIIESTPWTDKDLLTSLMKMKRHLAKDKYAEAFAKLYAK